MSTATPAASDDSEWDPSDGDDDVDEGPRPEDKFYYEQRGRPDGGGAAPGGGGLLHLSTLSGGCFCGESGVVKYFACQPVADWKRADAYEAWRGQRTTPSARIAPAPKAV